MSTVATKDASGPRSNSSSRPALSAPDTGQLKAFRYEDVQDGVPPVTVRASSAPRTPLASRRSKPFDPVHRPRTSPSSPSSGTSPRLPFDGKKRDSAIAPSISTTARTSYAESHHSSVAGGIAKEPSLPTIVVHDDEAKQSAERSRSPFARIRPKEKLKKARSVSPLRNVPRSDSFRAIDSNIPSGAFDDLDLGDLASDKIAFSNRGSLMFGGKKMNSSTEEPPPIPALDGAASSTILPQTIPNAVEGKQRANEHVDQAAAAAANSGLVAGRRKPSVQMLQAAIQGGRVLSAEEMTFSMKVRSMYQYGDDRAAQWVSSTPNESPSSATVNALATSDSMADMSIDEIVTSKPSELQSSQHPALREPASDMQSGYVKQHTELAGGIEDWDEVNGQDVDRYGFILPKKESARNSLIGRPGDSIQRIATSLRVEAEQPRQSRRLRRAPSSAGRSSRSVPPRRSGDTTVPGGSVRSFQSNKSFGNAYISNPFVSRSRRTVAEASDMLTLPPGLEDIHEQEDAGRTASMLKRREWSREQKWQKMAKPIRGLSNSKGAGMQFTFDTHDPKIISRTWKGIPDRWRATAWHSYLSASAQKRGIKVTDEELIGLFHQLQGQSSADDVQIDMDVPRTINMHIMFRRRYRGGQRLLFHVLHAISIYFPETGYVQGMASLAATLLCYYDEEQAFVMLVRLWQLRGLEQLYQSGFQGLMDALKEFEDDWLKQGDVAHKLEELGISSTAYGTRWYLTLFNMSVPFPAQLRIWDVFMLLGDAAPGQGTGFGGADLDVLHATSAALIDATREIIMDSDFENAMKVLTSFVPIRDEDLLMRVAKVEWRLRKRRAGG